MGSPWLSTWHFKSCAYRHGLICWVGLEIRRIARWVSSALIKYQSSGVPSHAHHDQGTTFNSGQRAMFNKSGGPLLRPGKPVEEHCEGTLQYKKWQKVQAKLNSQSLHQSLLHLSLLFLYISRYIRSIWISDRCVQA